MHKAPFPTLNDKYRPQAPHGRLTYTQLAQQSLRTRSQIAHDDGEMYFNSSTKEWRRKKVVADYTNYKGRHGAVAPVLNLIVEV